MLWSLPIMDVTDTLERLWNQPVWHQFSVYYSAFKGFVCPGQNYLPLPALLWIDVKLSLPSEWKHLVWMLKVQSQDAPYEEPWTGSSSRRQDKEDLRLADIRSLATCEPCSLFDRPSWLTSGSAAGFNDLIMWLFTTFQMLSDRMDPILLVERVKVELWRTKKIFPK